MSTRRPRRAAAPKAKIPRKRVAVKTVTRKAPQKRHVAPGLLSTGGALLGGALGGPLGAKLGSMAGSLISTLTGFGDYEIVHNSLHPGLQQVSDVPQVVNSVNRGGIIVRHREYLGDISAAVNFTQQQYFINPGLTASFPWLSNIAAAYEEFEFRGLVYEFKSLSSDSVLSSSTSSALGYVAMATQYNPANPPFADKHELDNYEFANSRKPSESFCHAVECKRRLNYDTHLFIRNGAVPSGQDQKTYDLGAMSIAVAGCQAATGVLGELWCTYEIEFFHPKYKYNQETLSDHFQRVNPAANLPLGTPYTGVTNNGSNLGCTITNGSVITFPNYVTGGQYLLTIVWAGNGQIIALPTITVTNGSLKQYWQADANTASVCPQPGISAVAMSYTTVLAPTPNASGAMSITFATSGGVFPSLGNVDIWITEVSSTISA